MPRAYLAQHELESIVVITIYQAAGEPSQMSIQQNAQALRSCVQRATANRNATDSKGQFCNMHRQPVMALRKPKTCLNKLLELLCVVLHIPDYLDRYILPTVRSFVQVTKCS